MKIRWKDLPNTNYAIANVGKVWSYKTKRILKTRINKRTGYVMVGLMINHKRKLFAVHALVAHNFLGKKPTPKHEVAHNDGNKLNNYVSNLRWATRKENSLDKHIHGVQPHGETHYSAKLSESNVYQIVELIAQGANLQDLADQFKVTKDCLKLIVRGERWSHLKFDENIRSIALDKIRLVSLQARQNAAAHARQQIGRKIS